MKGNPRLDLLPDHNRKFRRSNPRLEDRLETTSVEKPSKRSRPETVLSHQKV